MGRLKRNVKRVFRLITRRRVLGLLGLLGVGGYTFLEPSHVHRAARSVRRSVAPLQAAGEQAAEKLATAEPTFLLPPITDQSLPECPYETPELGIITSFS